jgi:hypothetical protein
MTFNAFAGIVLLLLLGLALSASFGIIIGADAATHPHYVVLKTQPRRVQQANLNSAASAGYRLVAETPEQTVLVKP